MSALTLLALGLSAACGWWLPWEIQHARSSGQPPPWPMGRWARALPADSVRGHTLFAQYCQHCHGERGLGSGCPDLSGLREAETQFLYVWIANPQMINPSSPMPRLDQLKPDEIRDIVAYLKSM